MEASLLPIINEKASVHYPPPVAVRDESTRMKKSMLTKFGIQASLPLIFFFFFEVPLVIKTFDLALMWAIIGLLFMATSCH